MIPGKRALSDRLKVCPLSRPRSAPAIGLKQEQRHPGLISSERFRRLDHETRVRLDWTPAVSISPRDSLKVNEEELKKQTDQCPVAKGLLSRFCSTARTVLERSELRTVLERSELSPRVPQFAQ